MLFFVSLSLSLRMIDIHSLSLSQPSHSAQLSQLYLQSILKVVDSSIMFNIKRAAYHDSETVTTPFIIKYMRSLYKGCFFAQPNLLQNPKPDFVKHGVYDCLHLRSSNRMFLGHFPLPRSHASVAAAKAEHFGSEKIHEISWNRVRICQKSLAGHSKFLA